jgi:hypothetical protein
VPPHAPLRLFPAALPLGAARVHQLHCVRTRLTAPLRPVRTLRADDLLIAAAGPLTHAPQAAVWGIAFAIAHAAHSVGWMWCARGAARATRSSETPLLTALCTRCALTL